MGKLRHRKVKSFASISQLIKYAAGLTEADPQSVHLFLLHGLRQP